MNGWFYGILAAAILVSIGYANHRRFVPRQRALGSKRYAFDTKDLPVDTGERTLCGQLLIPRGIPGKLPTVIVSHGLNSNGKNAKSFYLQRFCLT